MLSAEFRRPAAQRHAEVLAIFGRRYDPVGLMPDFSWLITALREKNKKTTGIMREKGNRIARESDAYNIKRTQCIVPAAG